VIQRGLTQVIVRELACDKDKKDSNIIHVENHWKAHSNMPQQGQSKRNEYGHAK